jgi:gamma-D-glutamyl-L-lysine dipeptidyl-peptidase
MKFAFCIMAVSPIRSSNSDASEMVSQLHFGEPFEVKETIGKWAKIITYFDHYEGWIDGKHFLPISEKELRRWLDGLGILTELSAGLTSDLGLQIITKGAFVPETLSSEFNIGEYHFIFVNLPKKADFSWQHFALSYLNTPYFWGGKSAFGIDCSGFSQQVFRFRGINISRDAYQQAELGQTIEFGEQESGDLTFFMNESGKITHVGIMLNEKHIIHASSWVRIDLLKSDGIYTKEESVKTHQLHSIKRL